MPSLTTETTTNSAVKSRTTIVGPSTLPRKAGTPPLTTNKTTTSSNSTQISSKSILSISPAKESIETNFEPDTITEQREN
jgi:hypothetical protein